MNPDVKAQMKVNTTALLAFTDLLRRAAVDHEYIHNNYPTHELGPKMNLTSLDKYITYFVNELDNAFMVNDSPVIQTYIRALGNIGHPDILPVFHPYLESIKNATKFQRLLMVTSLDKIVLVNPKSIQPVLFKLYINTAEGHEVRCAAVLLMMKTKPSAVLLQRMADFTNVDINRHVIATVQSSIRNAAALDSPSNLQL